MASCHEMKEGQIWYCESCGVELKVVKPCKHGHKDADECGCHEEGETCGFTCCGQDLKLKQ
ncbi:MAG: hypothetical protein JXR96_11070 [Deltaproteobacteria bacterium]|nr:hypothetical protein [Deltaproteobacteria bacterium]